MLFSATEKSNKRKMITFDVMKKLCTVIFFLVLCSACFSQVQRFGMSTSFASSRMYGKKQMSFGMSYYNQPGFSMLSRNPYSYTLWMQMSAPCPFLRYSSFSLAIAIQILGGNTSGYENNNCGKYFTNYYTFPHYFPPSELYSVPRIGE